MLEDSGRIRDEVRISELPEGQQKIWQVLVLQQVILHLALHLREGVVAFLSDKEIARDSDPFAVSHPMQSQAMERVTPTPEEIKAMIPLVLVGAYPAWMHIGSPESEMRREAEKKARELAEIIMGKTNRIA